jgi:hypothetical protein
VYLITGHGPVTTYANPAVRRCASTWVARGEKRGVCGSPLLGGVQASKVRNRPDALAGVCPGDKISPDEGRATRIMNTPVSIWGINVSHFGSGGVNEREDVWVSDAKSVAT